MRYIRKINSPSHWDKTQVNLYDKSFCSGDILLSELKTEKNQLSIWGFEDDSEIEGLLVAIALNRDNIQKLFYVIMDEGKIDTLEIPKSSEQGRADGLNRQDILEKHVNMNGIDFWRLGYIAEYMFDLTIDKNTKGDITEKALYELIDKYIQKGWIDTSLMKPTLLESYRKHKAKYENGKRI